ncbi:hypothetical protein FRC06_009551, partial [Ceratobasidium sp. 370]
VAKAYKQLEGKVSWLSSSAHIPHNTPPDPHMPLATHAGIEKRLASVEVAVGGFATRLEQQLKVVANAQSFVNSSYKQSIDQLLPLKSHVAALTGLSGRSEQLLALGKQGEATEAGMAKLFVAHEKGAPQYGELTYSMAMLRQTIEGLERKTTDIETDVETLGQDFKDAKDTWATKFRAAEVSLSITSGKHPPRQLSLN